MYPPADIYAVPMAFRAAEIGPDGQVSLFHVADLLQEAAGQHSERLQFGMSDLAAHNLTWALVGLHMRLEAPIWGGHPYVLHTWPSGTERLWALRRFIIACEGRECGQAVSRWMVLHRETHRPVRLPALLTERTWPEPPAPEPAWMKFDAADAPFEAQEPFPVRFTEIDTNGHVNNAHYLAWCINASPERLLQHHTPLETELHFEAEARWGTSVRVHLAQTEREGTTLTHYHVESAEDGRRLARVHIAWKPMLR